MKRSKKEIKDEKDWDYYWANNKSKIIYDIIAFFYRIILIRPSLNYHIFKFFKKNSYILHAGCGGGQVDKFISDKMKICAFDISRKALESYKKNNSSPYELIQGSVFKTEFEDNKFDGIYNLGVMEHFNLQDIEKILNEFNRILKDDGKIILFWPHKNGISVNFIKILKFISFKLFKLKLELHPEEITHVVSRKQIIKILEKSSFNLIYYYFGFRDLFTQSVVVAQKNIE